MCSFQCYISSKLVALFRTPSRPFELRSHHLMKNSAKLGTLPWLQIGITWGGTEPCSVWLYPEGGAATVLSGSLVIGSGNLQGSRLLLSRAASLCHELQMVHPTMVLNCCLGERRRVRSRSLCRIRSFRFLVQFSPPLLLVCTFVFRQLTSSALIKQWCF